MVNRTIQFYGQGYAPTGTTPLLITTTLAGNVVYTGTIPTLYTTDISCVPGSQVVLFTCELPLDFAGTVPMTIALDSPVGVDSFFEEILSNYMQIQNPVYTPAEIEILTNPDALRADEVAIWTANAEPALTDAEITVLSSTNPDEKSIRYDILVSHNLLVSISSGPDAFVNVNGLTDPRSNVAINGVSYTRGDTPPGTWGWEVEFPAEGSGTFTYDLTVIAGLA